MNKKTNLGIFLVIIILLIAGFFVLYQPVVDIEEYNVYSALIHSKYVRDKIKLVVIEKKTRRSITPGDGDFHDTQIKHIQQDWPELELETTGNFRKANQKSYLLKRQFKLTVNYILMSRNKAKRIFEKGRGWDDFYKKYPDSQGIITLSRVGFNSQKDWALVYISNQAHWLAGAGYVVLLAKENGVWKIKREEMIWIS